MEGLLHTLGLQFEIVQAICGRSLTNSDLSQFDHHDSMALSFVEYGCLLSHVKCWDIFLQSQADTALICEDDIHFSPKFSKCLSTLRVSPNEICLVRLETFLATVTADKRPIQKEKKYSVFRMLSAQGGAGAYVINRATAEWLGGVFRQMQHAIDIELFAPGRRSIPSFTVYQVIPAPCVQDTIIFKSGCKSFLRSSIGADRADIRCGLLKGNSYSSNRSIVAIIKRILHPLYRAIYSLFLGFSGKRRVKVRYR